MSDFDKANPNNLFKNFQSALNYEDARMNDISTQLSDVFKNKSKVSNELSALITKKYKDEVDPNYKVAADNKDIRDSIDDDMELKSELQKHQGTTKNISQQYKLNASNKPVSEDKASPKVFNPMLNRGYSLFSKVSQHNAYNAGFA